MVDNNHFNSSRFNNFDGLTDSDQKAWLDYEESFDDGSSESVSGEDWLERVYAGEVDTSDVGFAWDKEHILVGKGKVKDSRCGTFRRPKVKKLRGCLRVHGHNEIGVTLDGHDYRNKVTVHRVFYNCGRPECSSCYIRWAVREAQHAEARLRYIANELKVKFETLL